MRLNPDVVYLHKISISMTFALTNLEELPHVADDFLKATAAQKHVAFYGNMGVGKTTFIKALCHQLGVIETVTSPTFAIVNEYHTATSELVYHFDLYRINKVEELFDFGFEDYLFSPNYCFIEWPEKGEEVLPAHILRVTIDEKPDGSRIIEF
jgi:tRNA threonylcarbamoyladenosine biosynthesis protein TsaE